MLAVSIDSKSSALDKKFKWTGRYFQKIFVFDPVKGVWGEMEGWKNQDYHQASATFNQAQTRMIYTRCDEEGLEENFCRLYESIRTDNNWSTGRVLPFMRAGINYGSPWLSRDSILFFCSNDPVGIGGYDLFFSILQGGRWSEPVRLPSPVNSPGNEKFPTTREDTLFFSSDYYPGLGGLDVFRIHVRSDGTWSSPVNMGIPVNSPSDDFTLIFPQELSSNDSIVAYFSSSREEPEGLDKVFRLLSSDIGENILTVEDSVPLEEVRRNYKLFLSLRVVEKVLEDENDPNSRIIGKRSLDGVNVDINQGQNLGRTQESGRFIAALSFGTSYVINLSKPGFLQNELIIPPVPYPVSETTEENITISKEVELIRPWYDKEIVLRNIYYDLDKWDIREDAKPTLDELSSILRANPDLSVVIGSHTDCRADESYNLDLSGKRAESVVRYLQNAGIERNRMEYRGYGESQLIENCPCENCTERQHQRNRRTTFTLSKR